MGSVFFDLGIFFLGKNIKSLFCKIDNTNTINPRGKRFKDPGGYGLINFSNNKRLIFDTSEDTGLPYIITIKTKNIEFIIDEINNNFYYKKRPKEVMKKPLNYYLYKPELHKLPIFEKYDRDFYKIDRMLFSPAEVGCYSLKDGQQVIAGQRRPDILSRSLGESSGTDR